MRSLAALSFSSMSTTLQRATQFRLLFFQPHQNHRIDWVSQVLRSRELKSPFQTESQRSQTSGILRDTSSGRCKLYYQ
ncbi:hypothetical protein FGO68_gene2305 [Halteria grandinella]|uniref:Uncharacterized protein n=1 Tax=Halteria grandinella TaxID=5974 RepID=A0A8J8P7M6_HALGN|nr:hypothetical protein FGO68_gene2305 [Halteria grandinella]